MTNFDRITNFVQSLPLPVYLGLIIAILGVGVSGFFLCLGSAAPSASSTSVETGDSVIYVDNVPTLGESFRRYTDAERGIVCYSVRNRQSGGGVALQCFQLEAQKVAEAR